MNTFIALMLFMNLNAPVDLAMLDLGVQPDITVKLNQPAAGGSPATYYVLAEDSKVLTDEDGNQIRTE